MIKIRKSEERGIYDWGWLHTSHTFSFARYYDPQFIGFRNLLVINEDIVQPQNGFSKHYHDNMEIISYVLDGELEHSDNIGNNYKIKKGEIQVMTAGTGIMHSEKNPSEKNPVHFFQIWITPDTRQLSPSYQQKDFSKLNKDIILVASRDGRDDSLKINQDVNVYILRLNEDKEHNFNIKKDRFFWIQITKGNVNINGNSLKSGDGIYGNEIEVLEIIAIKESELLIFDLN